MAALGGVAGALTVRRLVARYGPVRVMLTALLAGAAGTRPGLWNTLALGTLALTTPYLVLLSSSTRTMHHAPCTKPRRLHPPSRDDRQHVRCCALCP
ncbi:hypothetical protein IPZ58_12090 [Streptomyces roseoverticillatus]|uniref:hypothetical protein n=1 Tax=Streptomyces roseoverticillatus TaxID=66429 RepID=UPI001F48B912|nr:hypothetical protein [Streptomyces roseoverticillatus]MCF3102323.1 hypothetical protein [Streptomyces roseoverticillatus]